MSPWLVVGLGNPGDEYAATRHNVGYLVVDELSRGAKFSKHNRARAVIAQVRIGDHLDGQSVVLAKSLTFMNESGAAVKPLLDFYKVETEQLIVVHDELDIPMGAIRVKFGGGDNGHNGLKSLRKSVGSGEFFRVRCGIGRPPGRQDPADFVLKPWSKEERNELPGLVDRAADAVISLITLGLEATQNRHNRDEG